MVRGLSFKTDAIDAHWICAVIHSPLSRVGTRIMVATLAVPESANYSFAPTLRFAIDNEVVDTLVPDPFVNWTFYSIFDRQGLKDGTHTINITVLMTSEEYPFFLDGFMFQPSKKYWSLAFAPENLEVDSGNSSTSASSSKPPVGAIVGGTLGGLLLVGLACAAFFWWWRKKQHVYMSLDGHDGEHETLACCLNPRFANKV